MERVSRARTFQRNVEPVLWVASTNTKPPPPPPKPGPSGHGPSADHAVKSNPSAAAASAASAAAYAACTDTAGDEAAGDAEVAARGSCSPAAAHTYIYVVLEVFEKSEKK